MKVNEHGEAVFTIGDLTISVDYSAERGYNVHLEMDREPESQAIPVSVTSGTGDEAEWTV